MSDTLAPTPETDAAAAEFVQTGNATALIARCSLFEISLHAQTARADALESLNATMHDRISGLVAENAAMKQERDFLAEWRRQQLTVTAWWAEIDAAVRKRKDIRLGEFVSAKALELIEERDKYAAMAEQALAVAEKFRAEMKPEQDSL